MDRDALEALHEARAAEKEQAAFYRRLAAEAEALGDDALAERLNGLHADEQHHLSRLTARLLEVGESPRDIVGTGSGAASLEGWETVARERESKEIARYSAMLDLDLDEETAALVREILEVERQHERHLGGKWTGASRGGAG
jgi:rubrerythrin